MLNTQSNALAGTNSSACAEYARLSRRGFLGAATGAAATLALPRVSFARGGGTSRPVLVGIFLRGAIDGLSTVVPYGDADLYAARPTLAIAPPGAPNGAVDLDGFFGLNPNAAALLTPFNASRLAIVHACGSPDPTRSHFDAMWTMETGIPDTPTASEPAGWLGRHLQSVSPSGTGTLRAIAQNDLMPRVLALAPNALPIADPADFAFPGNAATELSRRLALSDAYGRTIEPLRSAAASTLDSISTIDSIPFDAYVPSNGAVYPATPFGQAMRNTAVLIKEGIGLEVAHYDYGGWDHHNNQGPLNGTLAGMLSDLAAGLEAFYLDMQGMEDKYVLYAKSEFGRRVGENGSAGTDHGSGGIMLVMGHRVQGGQVHGTWPTLAPRQLDDGDVRVETDYRDVVAEILSAGLGGTDLAHVFGGHSPTPLGIVV